MADYLPRYKPGETVTYTASAAITAGQMVEITGNDTVGPAGANSTKWVGVAAFDAANGDRVSVHSGGIQKLTTSGTVTAGDLVVCAAAGVVSTLAAVTTPTAADVTNTRAIVGVAKNGATTGLVIDVQLDR